MPASTLLSANPIKIPLIPQMEPIHVSGMVITKNLIKLIFNELMGSCKPLKMEVVIKTNP